MEANGLLQRRRLAPPKLDELNRWTNIDQSSLSALLDTHAYLVGLFEKADGRSRPFELTVLSEYGTTPCRPLPEINPEHQRWLLRPMAGRRLFPSSAHEG
jgi:hypothetical protein